MALSDVYNQLGILFLTMLVGFVLGKIGLISKQATENFSKLIVKVAIPALIIASMMLPLTADRLQTCLAILLISIPCYLGSYLLGALGARLICRGYNEKAIFKYGMTFSNAIFMGLPVLHAILGSEAIFYAAVFSIFGNILTYSLGLKIVATNNAEKVGFNLRSVFRLLLNPGIAACIIGIILFLGQISLPKFLSGTIEMIGSICIPLSMLTLGAMLSGLSWRGLFVKPSLYVLTFCRLVVLPLIAFFLLKLALGPDNLWLLAVPVVILGMPVAVNAAMFAQEYGNDAVLASQSVFISTLFSCITIPVLAYIFI